MNPFCDYRGSGRTMCGMYTGGGRCERHEGLIDKPMKIPMKKFRGDSKWQKDMGMFDKK